MAGRARGRAEKRRRHGASVTGEAVVEAPTGGEISLAAAATQVWGPEDGFQDLLCDLNEALNPGSGMMTARYYAQDVTLDLTKALICDMEGYGYYVAPITVTDGDPTLSPSSDWIEADQAWVEANEEMRGRTAIKLAADGDEPMRDSQCADCGHAFADHAGDGGACSIDECGCGSYGAEALSAAAEEAAPEVPDANQVGTGVRWEALMVPEGELTDDGRMFAAGSLTWRELPLSLMVMTQTADGHDGAYVGGRIDRIWRDGANVRGAGVFDAGEGGVEAARMVADRVLTGLSVDVAVREYEMLPRSEVLANPDDPGKGLDDEEPDDGPLDLLDALFDGEDMVFVVTEGVIGAATVCPFPAFAKASISLVASASGALLTSKTQAGFILRLVDVEIEKPDALTASAAGMVPEVPPAEWFLNPELREPTPLTVTTDGRVYGHAATWGTCHIGLPGGCTVAPHTNTDYAYFHLGEIEALDGEEKVLVHVGQITLGTSHAGQRLGQAEATAHYDNTGLAAADVIVGDDEHGIWVAGALRPDVAADKARELRGAKVSGDWRNVNGNLELVALLAVNVPGFPVPRPKALVAYGFEGEAEDAPTALALVAAGVLGEEAAAEQAETPAADTGETEIAALALVADESSRQEIDQLAERAGR